MALVAGMAVPAGPFWALCTLFVAAELLSVPFGAARAALLPDVLPDDRYVVASAVSNVTIQGGQVLGFAAGGGLAAVLGTSALDAVTFGASAGLLWLGLRPRPAPPGPVTGIRSGSPLRSAAAGARLVGSGARLRALVGYAWLCGFFVVPEGPGVRARAVGHLRRAGSGHSCRRGRRPARRARCGGSGGRRRARSRHRHHADVELAGDGGWCVNALTYRRAGPAPLRGHRTPAIFDHRATGLLPGTRVRCAHVW